MANDSHIENRFSTIFKQQIIRFASNFVLNHTNGAIL